jgi:hypothetical protein
MSPDESDEFAWSRAMLKWPEFDEPFLAVLREADLTVECKLWQGPWQHWEDRRLPMPLRYAHRNRKALAPIMGVLGGAHETTA